MALYDKHGMSKTPEYIAWSGAKDRCFNPNTQQWDCYGGRGITMCDKWKNSFTEFYKDMGPRPSNMHSIDRIDNDGNYEPGNCRWATVEQQVYNRSTNRMVELPDGRVVTSKEAMDILDLARGTLFSRLSRDTPLDVPVREISKRYVYKGKIYTLGGLASLTDISPKLLASRLAGGMDIEKAISMSRQTPTKYSYLGEELTIPEIGARENIPAYLIRHHMNKVENGEHQISGIVEYIKRYYIPKTMDNGIVMLVKPALYARHGLTDTIEHRLWVNLKAKCHHVNNPDFKYYGAKGCTMCPEWKGDFLKFLEDVGDRPSKDHYFLVVDRTKPIAPGNWRWTTDMSEIRYVPDAKIKKALGDSNDSLISVAKKTGLAKSSIYDRLARGVPLDKLKRGQYLWEGQIRSAEELSKISGVPLKTLKKRITRGWPLEKVMDANLTSSISRIKNNLNREKKL